MDTHKLTSSHIIICKNLSTKGSLVKMQLKLYCQKSLLVTGIDMMYHMLMSSVACIRMLLSYRYLQEYSALGTAGGMYHFRDQILTGNPNLFFVMNADVCGDFPLQEMLEFHQSVDSSPHFTILGTEVDAQCQLEYGEHRCSNSIVIDHYHH